MPVRPRRRSPRRIQRRQGSRLQGRRRLLWRGGRGPALPGRVGRSGRLSRGARAALGALRRGPLEEPPLDAGPVEEEERGHRRREQGKEEEHPQKARTARGPFPRNALPRSTSRGARGAFASSDLVSPSPPGGRREESRGGAPGRSSRRSFSSLATGEPGHLVRGEPLCAQERPALLREGARCLGLRGLLRTRGDLRLRRRKALLLPQGLLLGALLRSLRHSFPGPGRRGLPLGLLSFLGSDVDDLPAGLAGHAKRPPLYPLVRDRVTPSAAVAGKDHRPGSYGDPLRSFKRGGAIEKSSSRRAGLLVLPVIPLLKEVPSLRGRERLREAAVEQVARHHVAERIEQVPLHRRMLAGELLDELLHPPPTQVGLRAAQVAGDDGKGHRGGETGRCRSPPRSTWAG